MSEAVPPQQGGQGSAGECTSLCANLPWPTILRVTGAVLGALVILLGVLSLTGSADPRVLINSVYRILFGFLIILAEARYFKWLRKFSFLHSYWGLGLFYIFVGGIALGGAWYEWIIALALLVQGLCSLQGAFRKWLLLTPEQQRELATIQLAQAQASLAGVGVVTAMQPISQNDAADAKPKQAPVAPQPKTQAPRPQAPAAEADPYAESAWPEEYGDEENPYT